MDDNDTTRWQVTRVAIWDRFIEPLIAALLSDTLVTG